MAVRNVGLPSSPPRSAVSPRRKRRDAPVWRATREFSVLGQLLGGVAWGELDVLLVDLPPGAERTAHHAEFLGRRASFVLVTIPFLRGAMSTLRRLDNGDLVWLLLIGAGASALATANEHPALCAGL